MWTASESDRRMQRELLNRYDMPCATGAMTADQKTALALAMTDDESRFVPYLTVTHAWRVWDKQLRMPVEESEFAGGSYGDATAEAERLEGFER